MESTRATIVGLVVGVLAAGAVVGLLGAGPVLAIGVGVTAAVALGLELWAVPKLNRRLGEETGSQRLAALAGGVAGGLVSIVISTLAIGLVQFDVSLGVMVAMMAFVLSLFVLGFGGAIALVVQRLSALDARVDPVAGEPADATDRGSGVPTEKGRLSVLVGLLVGAVVVAVALRPLDAGAFLAAGTGICGGTAAGIYVWGISALDDRFSGLEDATEIDYGFFGAVATAVGVLSVLPLWVPLGGLDLPLGVEVTVAGLGYFAAVLGAGLGIALVVVRLSMSDALLRSRSGAAPSSTDG